MHVHLVRRAAADDDDGIADRRELRPDGRHEFVVELEQVLHLVLVIGVRASIGVAPASSDRPERPDLLGQAGPRDRSVERVEQQHHTLPARIDDAGSAKLGEILLRPRERAAGPFERRRDHPRGICVLFRRPVCGVRGVGQDVEDGPPRRTSHGAEGLVGGAPKSARQRDGVPGAVGGQLFREPAQRLRQDDAGVAAGSHQRRARDRLGHLAERPASEPREFVADGLLGEQQVRAGVAVGDRIYVQRVQLVAVLEKRLVEQEHGVAQHRGVQGPGRRHWHRVVAGAHPPKERRRPSMSPCDGPLPS